MPIAEGAIAVNPATGQRIMLKGGAWVQLGSNQMQAQLPPADEQALKSMTDDLTEKQMLAQRANEFMKLNKNTSTGPIYGDVHIPLVGDVSPGMAIKNLIDPAGASNLQQMESVNNQTWVGMRPQGSGAMRMPEVHGFQQAFPNATNFGTANQAIAARLNHEADLAGHRASFVQDFVRGGHGSVADALTAWAHQTGSGLTQQPQQSQAPAPQSVTAQPPAPAGAFKILSVQ